MAQTKDSPPTNERLFALDASSLRLAEGAQLGQFTLGTDRLGAFSFLSGAESFGIIHIVEGLDARTVTATEAVATTTTLAPTDAGTVGGTETLSVATTLALTDAAPLTSTETRVVEAYPDLSDAVTIGVAETVSATSDLALSVTETIGSIEVSTVLTNDTDTFIQPYFIDASEDFEILAVAEPWFDASPVLSEDVVELLGDVVADDTGTIESETLLETFAELDVLEAVDLFSLEEYDLFSLYDLVDESTLLEEVEFWIESDTSTNDDATIYGDDILDTLASTLTENDIVLLSVADVITRIRTEIAYVSTQKIGGILRSIVSVDEIAMLRTNGDNSPAIMVVRPPEPLSATREDIDTDTSLIRIMPPEPTVDRTANIPEPSMYRTQSEDPVGVTRTTQEAPYAVTRTFKGEL